MSGRNFFKQTPTSAKLTDIVRLLNPFFSWMRLLGIELQRRKRINFYGLLILALVIWSNVDVFIDICWRVSLPTEHAMALKTSTFTNNWNIGIDYANHCSLNVAGHLSLFYVAQTRWRHLWNVLEKIHSNPSNRLDYNRLRFLFYTFASLIFLWVRY